MIAVVKRTEVMANAAVRERGRQPSSFSDAAGRKRLMATLYMSE
jgi:hypothetical protein